MRTYNTVNDILNETAVLHRNLTGKDQLTAGENDIVNSAIVDAYQMALLEYGVEDFKFHEEDVTADTTSGTNYINLDEYIFRIVPGSVRIPAEHQNLGLIDEEAIFLVDPKDEITGPPESYSYKNSGDPNIIRVRLWPIPDATYTINLKVLKFPTDAITNFPTHLMAAIKNKGKELSCAGLGLFGAMPAFKSLYEEQIKQIKETFHDSPKHVGRTVVFPSGRSVESRIPS